MYRGPKVSRQFQFVHLNFNFTHGNFNLLTAISISRAVSPKYSWPVHFTNNKNWPIAGSHKLKFIQQIFTHLFIYFYLFIFWEGRGVVAFSFFWGGGGGLRFPDLGEGESEFLGLRFEFSRQPKMNRSADIAIPIRLSQEPMTHRLLLVVNAKWYTFREILGRVVIWNSLDPRFVQKC